MKLRYIALLVVAAISLALGPYMQPVRAESGKEPAGFKNVTLWVYPEYDDPRLLVMLEGKITGVSPPAQVRFLVPAAAEMFSAGSKDAQGSYSGGPPNRQASQIPGWDEISYELKTDTFRVEYYYPIISGQPDKQISYDFRWVYPISDLKVIVQQPLEATNFAVAPKGSPTIEGGFNVQTYDYRNPDSAQPLHFDISYTKSNPNPSLDNQPLAPQVTGSSNLPLILTVAGILLVAGVIILGLKSRKAAYATKSSGYSRQTRAERRKQLKSRFCSQCGKAIESSARFCPYCGNKVGNSD